MDNYIRLIAEAIEDDEEQARKEQEFQARAADQLEGDKPSTDIKDPIQGTKPEIKPAEVPQPTPKPSQVRATIAKNQQFKDAKSYKEWRDNIKSDLEEELTRLNKLKETAEYAEQINFSWSDDEELRRTPGILQFIVKYDLGWDLQSAKLLDSLTWDRKLDKDGNPTPTNVEEYLLHTSKRGSSNRSLGFVPPKKHNRNDAHEVADAREENLRNANKIDKKILDLKKQTIGEMISLIQDEFPKQYPKDFEQAKQVFNRAGGKTPHYVHKLPQRPHEIPTKPSIKTDPRSGAKYVAGFTSDDPGLSKEKAIQRIKSSSGYLKKYLNQIKLNRDDEQETELLNIHKTIEKSSVIDTTKIAELGNDNKKKLYERIYDSFKQVNELLTPLRTKFNLSNIELYQTGTVQELKEALIALYEIFVQAYINKLDELIIGKYGKPVGAQGQPVETIILKPTAYDADFSTGKPRTDFRTYSGQPSKTIQIKDNVDLDSAIKQAKEDNQLLAIVFKDPKTESTEIIRLAGQSAPQFQWVSYPVDSENAKIYGIKPNSKTLVGAIDPWINEDPINNLLKLDDNLGSSLAKAVKIARKKGHPPQDETKSEVEFTPYTAPDQGQDEDQFYCTICRINHGDRDALEGELNYIVDQQEAAKELGEIGYDPSEIVKIVIRDLQSDIKAQAQTYDLRRHEITERDLLKQLQNQLGPHFHVSIHPQSWPQKVFIKKIDQQSKGKIVVEVPVDELLDYYKSPNLRDQYKFPPDFQEEIKSGINVYNSPDLNTEGYGVLPKEYTDPIHNKQAELDRNEEAKIFTQLAEFKDIVDKAGGNLTNIHVQSGYFKNPKGSSGIAPWIGYAEEKRGSSRNLIFYVVLPPVNKQFQAKFGDRGEVTRVEDIADMLADLEELRSQGKLTDREFERKKVRALRKCRDCSKPVGYLPIDGNEADGVGFVNFPWVIDGELKEVNIPLSAAIKIARDLWISHWWDPERTEVLTASNKRAKIEEDINGYRTYDTGTGFGAIGDSRKPISNLAKEQEKARGREAKAKGLICQNHYTKTKPGAPKQPGRSYYDICGQPATITTPPNQLIWDKDRAGNRVWKFEPKEVATNFRSLLKARRKGDTKEAEELENTIRLVQNQSLETERSPETRTALCQACFIANLDLFPDYLVEEMVHELEEIKENKAWKWVLLQDEISDNPKLELQSDALQHDIIESLFQWGEKWLSTELGPWDLYIKHIGKIGFRGATRDGIVLPNYLEKTLIRARQHLIDLLMHSDSLVSDIGIKANFYTEKPEYTKKSEGADKHQLIYAIERLQGSVMGMAMWNNNFKSANPRRSVGTKDPKTGEYADNYIHTVSITKTMNRAERERMQSRMGEIHRAPFYGESIDWINNPASKKIIIIENMIGTEAILNGTVGYVESTFKDGSIAARINCDLVEEDQLRLREGEFRTIQEPAATQKPTKSKPINIIREIGKWVSESPYY